MRLILFIFLVLCFGANAQIIRTQPYYRPFAVAASCNYYLDTYTGATAAYSVSRKMRTAYSGALFRVRRSTDNVESDISAISGSCEMDTAALKSFLGSASGFITTVYDQVNSNNATQSSASSQPRIVSAGVIDRMNGKPAMYFDGGDHLVGGGIHGQTRIDAYFVQSTSDATYLQFYSTSGGGQFGLVAQSGSNLGVIGSFGSTVDLYYNGTGPKTVTTGGVANRDSVYNWLNGTRVVILENTSTTGWGAFRMYGYGSFEFVGYLPEAVFWNSNQSSNRSAIRSALNNYYTVY